MMTCPVSEALEAMDDASYEIAAMVLDDAEAWSVPGLTKALGALGADLGHLAVMSHTGRNCLCYEPAEDEF